MTSSEEKKPSEALKKALLSTSAVTREIFTKSKDKLQETGINAKEKVKDGVEDVKAVAKSVKSEDVATTLALLLLV